MKTSTKASVILKTTDIELRSILKKDLQQFKWAKENKQVAVQKAA